MKSTYEIRFNRSVFTAQSLQEAENLAKELISADCPFVAKIVEIHEDGDFIQTVKVYNSANA